MAERKTEQKRPERQEVTLAKPHRHGGRWRRPGESLRLRPDQVERLRGEDKIR